MRCPVDNTPLKTVIADRHTIEVCPSCDGVRFDGGELHNIVRHFGMGEFDAFRTWEKRTFTQEKKEHHWQYPVRSCPHDGEEMQQHTFAGNSGIHIDHCIACGGYWFDGDDVTRLMRYTKPDAEADALAAQIAHEMYESQLEEQRLQSMMRIGTIHPVYSPYSLVALVQTVLGGIVDAVSREATR